MLSHHESHAGLFDKPPPLSTVSSWVTALGLRDDHKALRNERFLRALRELCDEKYTHEQKSILLENFAKGMGLDPPRGTREQKE